jgi:DNA-binding response OmpR family regulator
MSVNLATIGASEVVEKPFNVDDLLNKVALAVYRSRDADRHTSQPIQMITAPPETSSERDRGVVLVIEHDRARLQHLDLELSARGYTVVSMTRALLHLSRLARALRPRAILVDLLGEGVAEVVRELRAELQAIPLLVFTRGDTMDGIDALAHASDVDLVAFVDRQR